MKRLLSACLLFTGIFWLPASGVAAKADRAAKHCPTSFNPGSFTSGDFFSNFDNNCYLIAFSTGNGSGALGGDLNSVYARLFFCASATCNPNLNVPPFQLIIVGEFPNTRYFSVALYDDHSAVTQHLTDEDIVPLTAHDINPLRPNVPYVSGQNYAVPINLGGTPGTPEPGCQMNGYNVNQNALDGTLRHAFVNWNLYPGFFSAYPPNTIPQHVVDTPAHSNPNGSGTIMIRNYLNLTAMTGDHSPHVIVRDVATGCAYPASMVRSMGIVTTNAGKGNSWLDQAQVQNHDLYAHWQPTNCWINLPPSQSEIQWRRGDEYTLYNNPDAPYLSAYTPAGLAQTLASANEYLRLRFQVPTTPPTPCTNGCVRSGNEQARYTSVSFQTPGGATLASLPDRCPVNSPNPCTPLVQDPHGFVTLIAGTGLPQPPQATAANGYTWVDLTQSTTANYEKLNEIALRGILPASAFNCGANMIPYKNGEATMIDSGTNAVAGLMGLYAPVIDYPTLSEIGPTATEITGPATCASPAAFPVGPPKRWPNCAVGMENTSPQIGTVASWCTAQPGAGCQYVYAEPRPQISILSFGKGGFGSFPLGLPYTGTTNFLELTDTTQGWSAGYTGDSCTVTIGEWDDTAISVIANVNQNGVCPMAAGDNLVVTVWNPQNPSIKASRAVTVQPQSSAVARKP